jgi:DUF3025 family protein
LNHFADELNVRTASGHPVRFVPPGASDPYYELHLFATGHVQTRADHLHDLFNALAWLAFPRTKALINALHAADIPREGGRRGRRRDLLTLLDEGGAIVQCDDAELIALLRGFRWKELFWEQRSRVQRCMRFRVLGHATLEQALNPWPGIACRALFVPFDADPDAATQAWLAALPADATPEVAVPLPVFGYPDWLADNRRAEFYDDRRYFRPFREKSRSPRGTPDTAAPGPQAPPRDAAR